MVFELLIEHPQQSTAFGLVAVDGHRNFLFHVPVKHIGLPHHGPHARHLEHQPLHDAKTPSGIGRHEAPGLFGQVNEDGP